MAAALTILTYHSVDPSHSIISVAPSAFAEQMQCLVDLGIRGISLRDAITHRAQTGHWPDACAVLTFDDGYANTYSEVLPVLTRHGFGGTVFLISSHVGGHNDWGPAPPGLGRLPMLSWDEARTLASAGVEIGAHTRTHPDLSRLDAAQIREELHGAQATIAEQIGQLVDSFAYPFGNVSGAALQLAAEHFRASCTTELRRVREDAPHQLPRVDMFYIRSRRDLERLMDGQLDAYLTVRRWVRRARRLFHTDA